MSILLMGKSYLIVLITFVSKTGGMCQATTLIVIDDLLLKIMKEVMII